MAFHYINLIDVSSWEKAGWRDSAFLSPKDTSQPPILLLVFRDFDAAKGIFEAWQALLGKKDEKEILRVSIVDGVHPKEGKGYSIAFSADATRVEAAEAEDLVKVGTRFHFKDTGGKNDALQKFKDDFRRVSRYLVAPAHQQGTKLEVSFPHAIEKTVIYLRDYGDISSTDQDGVLVA